LVGAYVDADHLMVREVDLIHGGLDTVAQAPCRPGVHPVAATRSDLTDAATQDVLAWCRDSEPVAGAMPGHPLLDRVGPVGFRGECMAAPLHADGGPLGVVLLVGGRSPFSPADRALLARLREPMEAALANTAR